MILTFKVGDIVWFHTGENLDGLDNGKVVAVLNLEGWSFPHYVVEIETEIDPLLIVRDGFTLSDASDKPIGMWRDLSSSDGFIKTDPEEPFEWPLAPFVMANKNGYSKLKNED